MYARLHTYLRCLLVVISGAVGAVLGHYIGVVIGVSFITSI